METEIVYLVAIDGDMSAHGMGDKAHVIPFNVKLLPKVSKFLKAQLDSNLHIAMYYIPNKKMVNPKSLKNKNNNFWDQCKMMRDLGIFDSKYDSRTDWLFMQDLECIKEMFPKIEMRKPIFKIKEVA